MSQNTVDSLEQQLKSALNCKFINEQKENQLHITEHVLINEICSITNERDLLITQLETINGKLSEKKNQMSMIEICKASEQSKADRHRDILKEHVKGFESFFSKEESKIKEAKIERLKTMELIINESKEKTLAIKEECDSIELECNVLKKRNQAIMLQLRRKLVETHEISRGSIKKK